MMHVHVQYLRSDSLIYGIAVFLQASTLPVQRGFSTLPRKPSTAAATPGGSLNGGSPRGTPLQHPPGTPLQHPPPPPRRDPNTTLSVGRARARSMVASLALETALDTAIQGRQGAAPDGGAAARGAGESMGVKNLAQELELIFKRDTGRRLSLTTAKSLTLFHPTDDVIRFITK